MYGVTCPECGEVPPSKKHMYPNISANVSKICQTAQIRLLYFSQYSNYNSHIDL